ncbi:MAG: hypothetical protein ACK51V_00210, partial [bacterium]
RKYMIRDHDYFGILCWEVASQARMFKASGRRENRIAENNRGPSPISRSNHIAANVNLHKKEAISIERPQQPRCYTAALTNAKFSSLTNAKFLMPR